jgi:hypothetical protein
VVCVTQPQGRNPRGPRRLGHYVQSGAGNLNESFLLVLMFMTSTSIPFLALRKLSTAPHDSCGHRLLAEASWESASTRISWRRLTEPYCPLGSEGCEFSVDEIRLIISLHAIARRSWLADGWIKRACTEFHTRAA